MNKGDRGMRVAALSARLIASGDLGERPLAAKSIFGSKMTYLVFESIFMIATGWSWSRCGQRRF